MVKIDVDSELQGIRNHLSVSTRRKAQMLLANQVMSDMDQFVPYRHGDLRSSVRVESKGQEITYNTPYARAQFMGRVGKGGHKVKHYTTRGTGPHWDLKAKARYSGDWSDVYKGGLGL